MALGIAPAVANEILDAVGNDGATTILSAMTQAFVQLHTADPGVDGTTAVAGNATRKALSFGAAVGGSMATDADVTWTAGEVDTDEDYTHLSIWSAVSGGTFIWSGTMTANAVATGNEFSIPTGDLTVSLSVAA